MVTFSNTPNTNRIYSRAVPFEAHVTSLGIWASCRRLFQFTDKNYMNLEPKIPEMPYFRGRLLHYTLEYYYAGGRNENVAWSAFNEYVNTERQILISNGVWDDIGAEFIRQVALMRNVVSHYIMFWERQKTFSVTDDLVEWIAFENEYSVPLFDYGVPSILKGRIDGIVKYNGRYYIWEHKTASDPSRLVSTLNIAYQPALYMWATMQHVNIDLAGVIYNIVVPSEPVPPDMLKSGELSQSKSVKCSSVFYADCVNRLDIPTEVKHQKYGSFVESLTQKDSNFFRRVVIHKSAHQIKEILANTIAKIREITNPNTVFYHVDAPYGACAWCSFKDPCNAFSVKGYLDDSDLESYQIKVQRSETQ